MSASTSSPATPVAGLRPGLGRHAPGLVQATGANRARARTTWACADETASTSGDSASRTASSAVPTAWPAASAAICSRTSDARASTDPASPSSSHSRIARRASSAALVDSPARPAARAARTATWPSDDSDLGSGIDLRPGQERPSKCCSASSGARPAAPRHPRAPTRPPPAERPGPRRRGARPPPRGLADSPALERLGDPPCSRARSPGRRSSLTAARTRSCANR